MKDLGHFICSLAKSVIRIAGCGYALATGSVYVLAAALGLAEILGVAEEFLDKRA